MDPTTGSKNEFKWLFMILLVLPFIANGRKTNEDGVVEALGNTTNKYSKIDLDAESAKINTNWKC